MAHTRQVFTTEQLLADIAKRKTPSCNVYLNEYVKEEFFAPGWAFSDKVTQTDVARKVAGLNQIRKDFLRDYLLNEKSLLDFTQKEVEATLADKKIEARLLKLLQTSGNVERFILANGQNPANLLHGILTESVTPGEYSIAQAERKVHFFLDDKNNIQAHIAYYRIPIKDGTGYIIGHLTEPTTLTFQLAHDPRNHDILGFQLTTVETKNALVIGALRGETYSDEELIQFPDYKPLNHPEEALSNAYPVLLKLCQDYQNELLKKMGFHQTIDSLSSKDETSLLKEIRERMTKAKLSKKIVSYGERFFAIQSMINGAKAIKTGTMDRLNTFSANFNKHKAVFTKNPNSTRGPLFVRDIERALSRVILPDTAKSHATLFGRAASAPATEIMLTEKAAEIMEQPKVLKAMLARAQALCNQLPDEPAAASSELLRAKSRALVSGDSSDYEHKKELANHLHELFNQYVSFMAVEEKNLSEQEIEQLHDIENTATALKEHLQRAEAYNEPTLAYFSDKSVIASKPNALIEDLLDDALSDDHTHETTLRSVQPSTSLIKADEVKINTSTYKDLGHASSAQYSDEQGAFVCKMRMCFRGKPLPRTHQGFLSNISIPHDQLMLWAYTESLNIREVLRLTANNNTEQTLSMDFAHLSREQREAMFIALKTLKLPCEEGGPMTEKIALFSKRLAKGAVFAHLPIDTRSCPDEKAAQEKYVKKVYEAQHEGEQKKKAPLTRHR